MPYQRLILLFGHHNDEQGKLSDIARARCDTAIQLLKDSPRNVCVLPTGAFGKHFNTTDQPHSFYLSRYLIDSGVSPELILPGTESSNTFEDCARARHIVIDRHVNEVVAVTSDYHVPRVRFILEKVFQGIRFSIQPSPTPADFKIAEEMEEKKRFKKLKNDWPPKYIPAADNCLNKMVYEEAIGEHRHYDTVSLAVVSAMLVVGASPFAGANFSDLIPKVGLARASVFLVAAVIDFFLLHIYWRAAHNASVARHIMRNIEIALDCRGFSASYDHHGSRTIPMKHAVTLLGMGMMLVLIVVAAISWYGWKQNVPRQVAFVASCIVLFVLGGYALPISRWLRDHAIGKMD